MTRVCVLGAGGRMGRAVIDAVLERRGTSLSVVAAVDRPGAGVVGTEVAPGVTATDDVEAGLATADVYIDFTAPAATTAAARAAAGSGTAAVIGTTGLGPEANAALDALAKRAAVVVAPNFSLGVNLLLGLAEKAARSLGPEFDIEVVEIHHREKRDAPSGTAVALAGAMAAARNRSLDEVGRFSRHGDVGPRPEGEIGVSAVRGGGVIGEHTAYFFGPDERVEITHRAGSRTIFAAGAVRAASWAVNRAPGRYGMRDVLGL